MRCAHSWDQPAGRQEQERDEMKKLLDKFRRARKPDALAAKRPGDEAPLPPVFAKMLQVHIMETTIRR